MVRQQNKFYSIKLDDGMVKRLIDTGFTENKDEDLLKQAIKFKNTDIVAYILNKGCFQGYDTYLKDAIYNGNLEIIRLLLEHGANPNTIDYHKVYGFMAEFHRDIGDVMKLLLNYGLDVNIKNKKHTLAYIIAYFNDEETMIDIIPHINLKNKDLVEILYLLCRFGDGEIIKQYINHVIGLYEDNYYEVFLNKKDSNGNTALHYASMNENLEVVTVLLSYGVDFEIKNSGNLTAKDEVQRLKQMRIDKIGNFDDIINLLQSYEDLPTTKPAIKF